MATDRIKTGVGAPLLLASDVAVFFGAYDNVSAIAAIAALPIAVFEFALGVWLIVKGFNPSSPLFAQPPTDVDSAAPIPSPRTASSPLKGSAAEVG